MASYDIRKIAKAITTDPNVINENLVPDPGMPEPNLASNQDQEVKQFILMLNAVIASAPHGKQDMIVQRLAQSSPQDIVQMMQEVEHVGSTQPLSDYVMSKPSRIRLITQAAGVLFDEDTVWNLVDMIQMVTSTEEENEEGDYYDQGDDSDGH